MVFSSVLSAVTRRLEGKVALITGGASGIGECTAKIFAQHGAKIVIADVQDDLGHSVRESIGPTDCTFVHCDVTDEAQIKNAVHKAVATYGKLDIMFNNAGIVDDNKARIIDNEKADFERVLSVNVTGVFLGIKHAAQVMIPARAGSIISTASITVELGQFGIRVNCLSPYALVTPLARNFVGLEDEEMENTMSALANLKGVTLKAVDVANAALYLASDEARYISGHNLLIDGAFSIVNPSFNMFQYPP
ncbi:unnamed protein product [Prunus armeniaca]|uniref:Secoisolariciresinol dehydrogenase-like n=1 Tax=Prunus armeniaca TaxID=36596 RepID=A0A6J5XUH4_PRUAR|nr:unnamed protein product [Prunus armeniaca]